MVEGKHPSESAHTRKILLARDKVRITILEVVKPWRSIFLYVKVYAAIFIAMALAVTIQSPWLLPFIIVFIAGRQHSLYILNHDASHGSLFRSRAMNKWVGTLFFKCRDVSPS